MLYIVNRISENSSNLVAGGFPSKASHRCKDLSLVQLRWIEWQFYLSRGGGEGTSKVGSLLLNCLLLNLQRRRNVSNWKLQRRRNVRKSCIWSKDRLLLPRKNRNRFLFLVDLILSSCRIIISSVKDKNRYSSSFGEIIWRICCYSWIFTLPSYNAWEDYK